MKFKNYINPVILTEESNGIQKKIIEWFIKNPKPKDDDVHDFAEKEGIDTHKFEEQVYMILGEFLTGGRSKDFKGSYDSKELKMGIDVEKEHTSNPMFAEKIAKDHLAEFDGYYTALAKMEKKLEDMEK